MSTQPPAAEPTVGTAVVVRPRTEVTAMDFTDPVAMYMNTGIFDQIQRVARMMATSTYVPEHLREGGKDGRTRDQAIGDCFLVAAQAFRWKMDPFLVAAHTYPVRGKLGYEGKIIAALVNTHVNIAEPLDYKYSGAENTPERTVTVYGRRKSDKESKTVSGNARKEPAGWATDNPKWKSMTDQMLAYRGAREWARRYMPEAVLGVTVDAEPGDAEVIDLPALPAAPPKLGLDPLKEKLRAQAEAIETAARAKADTALYVAAQAEATGIDPDAADAEKEPPPPVVKPGKLSDGGACGHESQRERRLGKGMTRVECPECGTWLTQPDIDSLGPV